MYNFVSTFRQPSGSPIRELFKYLGQPGMISFAGGYPASDLFDVEGLKQASDRAYQDSNVCLQYGATDGIPVLKQEILRLMKSRNARCSNSELLVTTGSQQPFMRTTSIRPHSGCLTRRRPSAISMRV
jgi:DNA-binding transcriptional MocR family regulator